MSRIDVGPTEVKVHVYDLIKDQNGICGAFHTGVEVRGVEYSFAENAGVYECRPKGASGCYYRETIDMGSSPLNLREVYRELDALRQIFTGNTYDLIDNNCNDFSDALCRRLMGRGLPSYINRIAWWSRCCRCLYPRQSSSTGGGGGSHYSGGGAVSRDMSSGGGGGGGPKLALFSGKGHTLGGSDKRPLLSENGSAPSAVRRA